MTNDKYSPDWQPPGYREENDYIELVNYNSNWPKQAKQEIDTIKQAIQHPGITDIQHVGSTAVPGMIAKPIIDIQIAVRSLAKIRDIAIESLEKLGYHFWYGNPDKTRLLFIKGMPPFGSRRTHHVHIVENDSHHWRDKIFFRNYLQEHPEAVTEYAHLKQKLANQHRYDREKYTEGKTDFISRVLSYRDDCQARFTFRKVVRSDQKLILSWFEKRQVKQFYYGDGLQSTLRNIQLYCEGQNYNGHYSFDHWLAFINNNPFAFLMTSPVKGPYDANDDYNKWYVPNKKIFTLDLLIGSEEYLGKGLACHLVQQFILNKFSDADYFLIDPEQANTRAIHVYKKVGFRTVGEFCPVFNPKPHVMMRLLVDELVNNDN